MATALRHRSASGVTKPASAPRPTVKPKAHAFTVDQYDRLIDAGVLGKYDHTELIDGVIYQKVTQNEPHALALERLTAAVFRRLLERARIRIQSPLRLPPRSMPEPDIEVMRADAPEGRRPLASDVLFVVEISDTTLAWDRRRKIPLYAQHEIPIVWIVNVRARAIETHSALVDGGYGETRTYGAGESVPVPGFEGLTIPIDEVFPPAS